MPRASVRRAELPRDPYEGLLDGARAVRPLELRRMFGCWNYYTEGRLVWVSADKREPWDGILVPTEHVHHAALRAELPALRAHPVLGKWLYLSARHPEFEAVADRLASLIADGDARIGVVPGVRRRGDRARDSRKERIR